jgi:spore germination protein YaaH
MPDGPPAGPTHKRCGWIGPGDATGVQAFMANVSYFDVVHPAWYWLNSDGITLHANGDADMPQVVQAAAANNIRLWPLVAAVGTPDYIRTMMNNPTTMTAHIQQLVNLAVQHNYAGLDIDYEGIWTSADRAPYTAFLQQLTTAMHAAGKLVSIAGPALTSNASDNAWDYPIISSSLDAIHLMGYDYHWLGNGHVGPVAPLGWVDASCAFAASTGNAGKFILGVPNYGVALQSTCAGTDCDTDCGGNYDTVDTHMAVCPYGVWAAGRAPHCPYAGSTLYFDDLASLEEKVQAAHNHGLAGITYWTIGREHNGWFQMVQRYY